MRSFIIFLVVFILGGCASDVSNTRSLLTRLEFDENEYGTFELEGTVDINPLPLFSTNLHLKLNKVKPEPIAP